MNTTTTEDSTTPPEHDMTGWRIEKAELTVNFIRNCRSRLRGLGIEDPATLGYLHGAAHCATKLLSEAAGKDWTTKDADLVLGEDGEAFEVLKVRYGVLKTTKADAERAERHKLAESILPLLEEPRGIGRPNLHGVIGHYHGTSAAMNRLLELLEEVSFGRMEWDAFGAEAKTLVDDFKSGG